MSSAPLLRSWPDRLRQIALFELGGLLLTLPIVMVWTGLGWRAALVADLGLALTYTLYALLFNLAYDRLFPIPTGARPFEPDHEVQ